MKPDIIHIAALEAKDDRIKELEEEKRKMQEIISTLERNIRNTNEYIRGLGIQPNY